jgi:uncharacterized membrane protein YgdD (TMEM256/DUF423 family)
MTRRYLLLAAINGFVVVVLGAFGAHALEARLSAALLDTWHTAVQYQMFHTLGLLVVAAFAATQTATLALQWSGRLFAAGLLLFCGSLYLLALTGIRGLGAITPIGGVAWLAAWALLARVALAYKA